jgi:very-short-patch-repair endonuclease
MITAGLLVPAHRGVYTFALHTPTELGDETAALLACREGAVLSHHSAAVVWEVWPSDKQSDGHAHITVPGGPAGRQTGIHGHRSRRLTRKDVRRHRGLPVTSPARTLLDLAPALSARDLERLFDEFLVKRLIRPEHLVELLGRCGHHPGRGALRRFIEAYTDSGFTRSEAERLFRDLIREARLPEPQTNVRLHGYEVDAYWPQHGLAVEIDGYAFHRSRSAFENDRRKSAHLQAEGIATMRVTWHQLKTERVPVAAAVARALGTAP